MSLTADLTAEHLAQLEALLADTTPGGGLYRPPVARDINLLGVLSGAGLAVYTSDCGYEITDAGRAIVVDRAVDAAHTHVFVLYATDDELHAAISALKVTADTDDTVLRHRALTDLEACQDELDRRVAVAELAQRGERRSESTGRHHLVEVDERPTAVIPQVQEQTAPMALTGVLDVPDKDAAERLLAAIKGSDTGQDVYDGFIAETTGGWDALEADLGDDRSWLRRNLTPRRKFVLTIVVTVVATWFAAWLVMG
ncbi:hypothetical protein [Amycolatopsis kentuckyensis]|uniref:hypothetical protein n=1 Tax=Amycolatopsis kentuckyensis TaxID=218823 RepID=UPI000A3B64C9|nr:hypothetical protein [Amycolatopsis kentuckyensis]